MPPDPHPIHIYEPDCSCRTILHEYAHVLSMDAQYGADAVLSAIFGRVMRLAIIYR